MSYEKTVPKLPRPQKNQYKLDFIAEISIMEKFQELLQSDEGKNAMGEGGLKVEAMRMLIEFNP